ncbi:MAG TPA: TIGR02757 family protein [Vicinamibacterales bacterium]|nr:TIGR02757 family protein [Vicinamibacterales bacterium]
MQGRHARHQVLAPLKGPLDGLYASFDHPESALDPIQIVRRFGAVDDREIVAFVAAGLAFGRVASVMVSVEAMCQRLGPSPASFVRAFDPVRDTPAFAPIVHRWTRGADLAGVIWILKTLVDRHGSLERAFARGLDTSAADVESALEAFSSEARAVDLRPIYGRANRNPGAHYFFSRPSTGSACKRLNLFLRWMIRQDGVDPGGWTMVPRRQLIVPLDTHTIRAGKCLRLTKRASPGWKMAAEITGALRAIDADDPVRYDFSLCHLSMMGNCGYQTKRGNLDCPLKSVCRPAPLSRSPRR